MTQSQLIILLLKIGLISGLAALVAWVTVYLRLTRGNAWHNPLGRTLIVKSLLIAGLFVPQILSLFFHLNRSGSRVVAWADVVLIGAVTPAMCWRIQVWLRLARPGRLPRNGNGGGGGQ